MQAFIRELPSFADLVTAPIEAILLAKLSILLALAWLVHGMLATCNPRARVLLWRATILGVAAIPVLTCLPPILIWKVAAQEQSIEPAPSQSRVSVLDNAPVSMAPPLPDRIEAGGPRIGSPPPVEATISGSSHNPTTAPPTTNETTLEQTPLGQTLQAKSSVSNRAWLWFFWGSGVLLLLFVRLVWSFKTLGNLSSGIPKLLRIMFMEHVSSGS